MNRKYKYSHAKIFDFIIAADKEILNSPDLRKITDFEKYLFTYQIKHFEKYGNYLIF